MGVRVGDHRFGFNGKEKDQNQEWGDLTHYDYGARIYNSSIGRWLSVDPLRSKYPDYSPYAGIGNNPIIYNDPNGEDIIIRISWQLNGSDEKGTRIYKPVLNFTVTGAVINASFENWDVSRLIGKIKDEGDYYLSGKASIDNISQKLLSGLPNLPSGGRADLSGEVDVNFSFKLQEAEDLNQVNKNDHLFIIGNFVKSQQIDGYGAMAHGLSRGISTLNGGRTAIIDGTNTSSYKSLARIALHEFWSHLAKGQAFHDGGKLSGPGDVVNKWFVTKNSVVYDSERSTFLSVFAQELNNLGSSFSIGKDALGRIMRYIDPRVLVRDVDLQTGTQFLRHAVDGDNVNQTIREAGVESLRSKTKHIPTGTIRQ